MTLGHKRSRWPGLESGGWASTAESSAWAGHQASVRRAGEGPSEIHGHRGATASQSVNLRWPALRMISMLLRTKGSHVPEIHRHLGPLLSMSHSQAECGGAPTGNDW